MYRIKITHDKNHYQRRKTIEQRMNYSASRVRNFLNKKKSVYMSRLYGGTGRSELWMNRGKDRRRHVYISSAYPVSSIRKLSRERSQRTRAPITHIAEKRKQTLDHLTFANRKRGNDVLLKSKSYTSGRDMECRGPTDSLSLFPKSARCLPSQKKKNIKERKIRMKKRN